MKLVLFCPDASTGGPFALYQLYGALTDLGVPCEVAIYDRAELAPDGTGVTLRYAEGFSAMRMVGIEPVVCYRIEVGDVLVFPETLLDMGRSFFEAGFRNNVVWWLSWDNAPISALNDFPIKRFLLSCSHIFQSHHALGSAKQYGLDGLIVSDYTVDAGLDDSTGLESKTNDLCYLGRKSRGAESIIQALSTCFSVIEIEAMSHSEAQATLAKSRFFIDFGKQPGKDRIPREAVMRNCIPIVRRIGAGAYQSDFPLPDFLRVPDDVFMSDGGLISLLNELSQKTGEVMDVLSGYRAHVGKEKLQFYSEVEAFLSTRLNIATVSDASIR